MTKKAIGFISLLAIVSIIIITPAIKKRIYYQKQDNLAGLLGVDISHMDDYERMYFPKVYFQDTLETGMTSAEVHKIVRGYEAVYLCKENYPYGDYEDEFYYYYSLDDNKAMRFKISYNSDGKYDDFFSEDANSRLFGSPDAYIEGPRED